MTMKRSSGYFKRVVKELTERENIIHQKVLKYINDNPNISYKEARQIVTKEIIK
ncbi:hypothetical protein FOPPYZMZ_CDS0296 [Pseudomonas phage 9Ps-7B]|nr:hypothetical protein IPCDMZAV_CDS0208 [Pseudomonas phage 6B]WRQ06228.1 hypothetical protein QAMIJHJT_CDS0297 [Pseudomonas phage 9-Ps-8B]WRQ06636.1 hypothetical protein FOPPYZMZ_CDS0296 [Pseudomonas phage 9Ps-7B]WRQ06987.1 hypothetical protein ZBUARNPM_CDS0238 [Pseudomonas phage 14Ps5-6]BDR26675.1 hypothetical protein RVBP18_3300 [Pseudomonas phage sp. LC]